VSDFLFSKLIGNAVYSLTPTSDKARDYVAELPRQFQRFIGDTLVLTESEVEFLCPVISANYFSIEPCKFRGYPGVAPPQPLTLDQQHFIFSLIPNNDPCSHYIKTRRQRKAERQARRFLRR